MEQAGLMRIFFSMLRVTKAYEGNRQVEGASEDLKCLLILPVQVYTKGSTMEYS